jgi:hypothetical protein
MGNTLHHRQTMNPQQVGLLASYLQPPIGGVGSEASADRPFIDGIKRMYPGLDRSQSYSELADRWINVVILRGVQIMLAFRGFGTRLLGAHDTPYVLVHRGTSPLAVRTITPEAPTLFAPTACNGDCVTISKAIGAGASATLAIFKQIAWDTPIAGDAFATQAWGELREQEVLPRVFEYLALFKGRDRREQIEMALSLSERVLTGRDDRFTANDRLIQAAAAAQMWGELGELDVTLFDPIAAARRGWSRVASLGIQEERTRHNILRCLIDAMARVASGDPTDIEVAHGKGTRVYRFEQGTRTLIDRRGSRVSRVH